MSLVASRSPPQPPEEVVASIQIYIVIELGLFCSKGIFVLGTKETVQGALDTFFEYLHSLGLAVI